ncbi:MULTISPECIES: DUF1801 domain-containing protein [unclassified Spirosoma]|uniref:DUF1801 domain-containing protein n=1 Tax=unclassified Spirosoma TaxID=2621999 RepID=UPI0009666EB4|nr:MULTISPECIES: DUF1801 domain-containing protein [unclassified Spirosoma]MBN8820414.1 DUF1801 domain-containing protein [Spirosoma sp.]OJW76086.1 MAG: hypothetical protein BGO59_02855 [Spirosoma sp. 48-14]
MATNKTTETNQSVTDFINAVADETKRIDSFRIVELMQIQTGFEPKMWGASIVGFGSYHYKYDSGREGNAPLVGFSPRANALTLYLGTFERKDELLQKLGKHKIGKGCVYIKNLRDVDADVLKEMVTLSVKRSL